MADVRRSRVGANSQGDHIVFIYDAPTELLAFAVPFITEGLAKHERCIYVVDDLNITQFTDALVASGVDVRTETERGALVLMNAQEFYQLPLVATHVIKLTRERLRDARSRGFSGLRVAAEMTWALKAAVPEETLAEYEALFDDAFRGGTATVACEYRRDRFSTALLQRQVRIHPKMIASDPICVSLSGMFQGLTRTDLQTLVACAAERRIPKGGFFYHQGDLASEVFVLTAGRVKTVRTDAEGRSLTLRLVIPPEPFGHISALGGSRRYAAAQAAEDSRALVWDVSMILQMIKEQPEVSASTVQVMAAEVIAKLDQILDLGAAPVERRLARFLLRLADRMGRKKLGGIAIGLTLPGEELASMVNTTPYTVSRILAAWRRLNLIDVQREGFFLREPARLAEIAGESSTRSLPGAGQLQALRNG